MSFTFSYHAYYGNDGSVLSGRASLANGFAYVRSHNNPTLGDGLPAFIQAQKFASKGLLGSPALEEQLKARRIFLFNIFIPDSEFPSPLFNDHNMRGPGTQDFSQSLRNVMIIVEEEEEEEEQDEEGKRDGKFGIVDLYPAIFRKAFV